MDTVSSPQELTGQEGKGMHVAGTSEKVFMEEQDLEMSVPGLHILGIQSFKTGLENSTFIKCFRSSFLIPETL